jgi:AbrB family looped-hinge helix DNA binding protein
MLTKLSSKGQTVIPAAIRELARLETGDELEVGYMEGMVILRKRIPLSPKRVRDLLRRGRNLPELSESDESAVTDAISRVRRRAAR